MIIRGRIYLLVVLFSLIHTYSYPQIFPLRALHVGDTLPGLELQVLNGGLTRVTLPDTVHRLSLLSFWSPSCSFSTGELYRLARLQQSYPAMDILPVGFDVEQGTTVEEFITLKRKTKKPVPLRTGVQSVRDSVLTRLFPFRGVPHYVWLNEKGIVLGITDDLAVNTRNIEAGLRGEPMHLALKYFDPSFDAFKPLLVNGNGGNDSTFVYRSLFTSYNPGIDLPQIAITDSVKTRIAVGNMTPYGLILAALSGIPNMFGKLGYDPLRKRVLIETGSRLFDLKRQESLQHDDTRRTEYQQQEFCYELLLPSEFSVEEGYRKMLADVCSFFKIKVSVQKRQIPCLLLTANHKRKLLTKGNPTLANISEDKLSYRFGNCTVDRIISFFNACLQVPFIKNETGIMKPADLEMDLKSLSSVKELQICLSKYGLHLQTGTAYVDVLVIGKE